MSIEQKRKFRNEPTTRWSTNLQQGRKEYPMGKAQCLQQVVFGKAGSNMEKNETGPLTYTRHKNKFKMD